MVPTRWSPQRIRVEEVARGLAIHPQTQALDNIKESPHTGMANPPEPNIFDNGTTSMTPDIHLQWGRVRGLSKLNDQAQAPDECLAPETRVC